MTRNLIFSSGVESAALVISSNLLGHPLDAISELYAENTSNQKLSFKVKRVSDLTVIAFVTPPLCNQQAELVSSSALKEENFPDFKFLCNKKIPYFSVNKAVISLFNDHLEQLHELKSQIDSSMKLIVTGHALGGSIASLFTLWLIDNIRMSFRKKYPLCITFGSPLIGDKSFSEAISRSSSWNSCFLHVASHRDPLPSFFISNDVYKPFGTFLLCSDQGSACFNDPESILEILATMRSTVNDPNQVLHNIHHYANIEENLSGKSICKAFTPCPQNIDHCDSLKASTVVQLQALGLSPNDQVQRLVEETMRREIKLQMKRVINPFKKLYAMEILMCQLEWYEKYLKSNEIGMYDMCKKRPEEGSVKDQDAQTMMKQLTLYWQEMVEEAEMNPQKQEGSAFRTPWLIAGTSYRRLFEPFDIAKYYMNGGTRYEARGRSRIFQLLDDWLEQERPLSARFSQRQNVEPIVTFDSCFWARVEEALIACVDVNRSGELEDCSELMQKLREFEDYVYESLKIYAVSPYVFLKRSTYMVWWREYKHVVISRKIDSRLASFMWDPANYELYAQGAYVFP